MNELCTALEVSRSGFYDHKNKPSRPRRQEDQLLSGEVLRAFESSRKTVK